MIEIGIGVLVGLLGIAGGLYYYHQAQQTFQKMDVILDEAISGKAVKKAYDESYPSKLEEKLSDFLQTKTHKESVLNSEEANVKELISNIAHQTKTPLTNISIYSQLLQEEQLEQPTKKYVEEISRQTEKLNFFIENLVKTSYLENELIHVAPVSHAVNELVEDVLSAIQPTAAKKNISLKNVPEAPSVTVVYDERWTKEALGNILDNAIKYSPADTQISVDITILESFVKIDIADQGKGIAEEEQGAVFERFYRSKDNQDIEGLGIGLYLARKIMQLQQGYIKLESQVDKGSTFSIYLRK